MSLLRILAALALVIAKTGCAFRVHGGFGPPPVASQPGPPVAPPSGMPAARHLTPDEARQIAMSYAASRGFVAHVEEIEPERGGYEVELEMRGPHQGEIELWIDGYSGAVTVLKEKVKHRRHDRHDDDD